MTYVVYGIYEGDRLLYVGCTKNGLRNRMSLHISQGVMDYVCKKTPYSPQRRLKAEYMMRCKRQEIVLEIRQLAKYRGKKRVRLFEQEKIEQLLPPLNTIPNTAKLLEAFDMD